MKITSIIENTSRVGLPVEHGLSLYVELDGGQRVLFDMGQGTLFAENAALLGLSIQDVDVAVVSHGHYDHGGGLATFLSLNSKAPVYIHRDAFEPHYSQHENLKRYIGLEQKIKELQAVQEDKRLRLCDDLTHISPTLTLFANVQGNCCLPSGNARLFGPTKVSLDTFSHEQNLIIEEGEKVVLLAGCAHKGIVNIMRQAESIVRKPLTHVLAGMHLVKSGLSDKEEGIFIHQLANELLSFTHCKFYTMHCTGQAQFELLHERMGERMEYLSCGERIRI